MTKKADSELFNIEAEKSVLSLILLDAGKGDTSDTIFSEIELNDFYLVTHRIIFTAMKALYLKGVDVDLIAVCELLKSEGSLDTVGGLVYIADISTFCLATPFFEHHIKIIKNFSKLRLLQAAGQSIVNLALGGQSAESSLIEAERLISDISEQNIKNDIKHIGEVNKAEIERLKSVMSGKYDRFGLETGFAVLDKTLWGLQKSDMITIAARPGVGKTAFALNVLNHIAVKQKKRCIFFSLEMPKEQIIQRLYSINGGIDSFSIKSGQGLNEKRNELNDVAGIIAESGLYIDDKSNITVSEMLAKARRLKRKSGLDLIVIDYLQFVRPCRVLSSRANEVGEIARDIKNLARQLDIPVIVLAQVNRDNDKNDRLPVLADLRESGEIESNSDIVMFLHRRGDKEAAVVNTDLIIGKFRNGQMKNISFTYTGNIFKFEEISANKRSQQSAQITLTPVGGSLPFEGDLLY